MSVPRCLILVIVCVALQTGPAHAMSLFQCDTITTTVDSIMYNPGKFVEESVAVEGVVTQYVAGTANTRSYYLLKGDFGAVIRVNTNKSPEVNVRYFVEGVVIVDPMTGEPFITETDRQGAGFCWKLWLIIAAIVVLAIVTLLILILRRNKEREYIEPGHGHTPSSGIKLPTDSDSSEYKTVIYRSDPKTMKFIPGKLVFTSGEDEGKFLVLTGYPTAEGNIVTMGRDSVSGDRQGAHIKIDNKFKTVGHKQAEFIYKGEKLYVKNVARTNPTQVDGIELTQGQVVELKPNSLVRTGELEFKYLRP